VIILVQCGVAAASLVKLIVDENVQWKWELIEREEREESEEREGTCHIPAKLLRLKFCPDILPNIAQPLDFSPMFCPERIDLTVRIITKLQQVLLLVSPLIKIPFS
jgi:hypothetical protein